MTWPLRQSLTVVVPVTEVAACRAELHAHRPALERGWATLPGLHTACVALLPAWSNGEPCDQALLLECGFEGPFNDFAAALFQRVGSELSRVLGHCQGYPVPADQAAFTEYLSARARRAVAFREANDTPAPEASLARLVRAALDSARLVWSVSAGAKAEPRNAEALEAQRLAVGMQEPELGVPLVHQAQLLPEPRARARLKRALRDVELEPVRLARGARFLVHGDQLLFLAYPDQPAPRWSERTSELALPTLTRIWANTVSFSRSRCSRRARRARCLQRFLLDHRVPVAAWFNAQPVRRAP